MACLEYIDFGPWREVISGGTLTWEPDKLARSLKGLPQIFWKNGEGWAEANDWALEKAATVGIKLDTVKALMKHLCRFAGFLEREGLDWRHFPIRKSERAIVRFRGNLLSQVSGGSLASSTARSCMRAVIQFYRYAEAHEFISPEAPMWRERSVVLPFYDAAGFKRALVRVTTDLAIPNRSYEGIRLEEGLLPLSEAHMTQLLDFTSRGATEELHLMLTTGLFSGARIGTISTLRIENLEQACPDPYLNGFHLIRVGPGTGAATKFDVEGDLLIPPFLLAALKSYAYSVERLKREAKARSEDKSTLFLTIRGRPYCGPSINRLMTDLRRDASRDGLKFMATFKFHQTRATYGTWLMKLLLGVTTVPAAIEFVKNAMLHKDESATFKYIRFLDVSKGKEEAAAAFSEAFTGLRTRDWNRSDA